MLLGKIRCDGRWLMWGKASDRMVREGLSREGTVQPRPKESQPHANPSQNIPSPGSGTLRGPTQLP